MTRVTVELLANTIREYEAACKVHKAAHDAWFAKWDGDPYKNLAREQEAKECALDAVLVARERMFNLACLVPEAANRDLYR
jgi:hypothetical protein